MGLFSFAMYRACYNLRSVHFSMPDHLLVQVNAAMVEGLAGINQVLMRYYDIPPLYDFRPKYYVPKTESWKDVLDVMADGNGDCKDFVAWRLAELRRENLDARAESTVERVDRRLKFHTFIRHANGRIEDPSVALGMNR